MLKRLRVPALVAVLGACLAVSTAAQGAWPDRPVRLIVPYPPGGTSDNLGRLVAERLGAKLGATVIVDNKPGGTTQIGTELAARAAPDGYTVLLGAVTAFTVLPHLRSKLPYDPKRSFEPLGGIAEYLSVVAVRKDLGVGSLAELIALAKARPGKLSYGSAGLASFGHIAGEILQREAGVDMLHVPFKGSADAATALAAGQVDVLIDGAAVPLAKAGRVVPLAAFSAARHPELPAVPSLSETGIALKRPKGPGWGLFTPKGTPAAINDRISRALQDLLAEPDTQARLQRISTVPDWRTPEQLERAIEADWKFYGELLPAIGMRAE
jgi:tripartite-type tricarboxylate transporter receptor subunit TctC